MKIIYSDIFKKAAINENVLSELEKILPEKFFLAYILQYKKLAFKLKERFKERLTGFSQVTGCSNLSLQNVNTALLIGEGKFHALNLLRFSEKVIIFDGQGFSELGKQEKAKMQKENKIKFANLLSSSDAGILVSIKPGQCNINTALKAQKELENLGKKAYFFFFDTLNPLDLENFNIKAWLNTSCPGLEYDLKNVINAETFFHLINPS